MINNDFYLVKSLKIKKVTRFTPHYPRKIPIKKSFWDPPPEQNRIDMLGLSASVLAGRANEFPTYFDRKII